MVFSTPRFEEAVYRAGESPSLLLRLGTPLPQTWIVRVPPAETILSSDQWQEGHPEYCIDWSRKPVPFVLEVLWGKGDNEFAASWPVNVEDPAALPPPEALRNISLEEFIEILSSTRSLHRAVAAVIAKRNRRKSKEIELDPHKRVNTEEFLLRRTQRVALALDRLRERLERPVLTREALEWRLSGPLGPKALSDLFLREAKHPAEAAFFLAELSLSLKRVDEKRISEGGFNSQRVRKFLKECIHFVRDKAHDIAQAEIPPDVRAYTVGDREKAKLFEHGPVCNTSGCFPCISSRSILPRFSI